MRMTPTEDEFDAAALDGAYEAFFDADGGNYGGVRAAIKAYNEAVTRARITKLAERNGLRVEPIAPVKVERVEVVA
jgi:hypothetical protein